MPERAHCPHCFFVFEKNPKRAGTCPKCGKEFFVRGGIPVTQTEIYIRQLTERVAHLGITELDVRAFVDEAGKRSFNDYYWGLLNQRILFERSKSKPDYEVLINIYTILGNIAVDEGKDPTPYRALEEKCVLLHLEGM